MPPNPQQRGMVEEFSRNSRIAHGLCASFGLPVTAFLRRGVGQSYYATVHAVLGLAAIPVFGLFFPPEGMGPLLAFAGLALVFMGIHRLEALRQFRLGRVVHSRYGGGGLPRRLEPAVPILAGAALCGWQPATAPLGIYLVAAGVALAVTEGEVRRQERARLRAMHDAAIEQAYYSRKYRDGGF